MGTLSLKYVEPHRPINIETLLNSIDACVQNACITLSVVAGSYFYFIRKIYSVNSSVIESDDKVGKPNTEYKKLRPSFPDIDANGKENKTLTQSLKKEKQDLCAIYHLLQKKAMKLENLFKIVHVKLFLNLQDYKTSLYSTI